MSNFRHDVRQWKSVDTFRDHLAQYDPGIAPWAIGCTLHHTVVPTLEQWLGMRTMQGMMNYYKGLGWDAGPHLFIAVGSPYAEHDGIWQMTALNERGIHAGVGNTYHWGIEVVGNYDVASWSPAMHDMVRGVVLALLDWRHLSVDGISLKGHREWGSPKTCPGRQINMDTVRMEFAQAQVREQ